MSTHYSRFRHVAIERAKPAPTNEQLAAIEDLLGAPLPASFRAFLHVANGGYIEYVIDVPLGGDKSEALGFSGIFSANDGNFCDGTFVGEIRSSREYQKIPQGVLPFARDGGGSMAYLDLSSQGNGRIVAFVHGLPEWTGLRTHSKYIELASSFDEYVDKLRIDREVLMIQLEEDAQTAEHVNATEEYLDIAMPSWREDSEIEGAVNAARKRVSGHS
jgi:hypothetical protein